MAFGMNWKVSVSSPKESNTNMLVIIPPNGVRTPLALLIAVRENEPVTGIDDKNEPNILQQPSAISSCVASKLFPLAETLTS